MPVIEHILSTIAPHYCVGCNEEGALLCQGCRTKLTHVPSRCYRCQQVTECFRTCAACRRKTALYAVTPAAMYEGAAKELLHKLKFEHARAGAEVAAGMLETILVALPADVVITHVPTATSRVRQRGYDQAALIARSLARRLSVPYAPLLTRYGQQRQVGKNRKERQNQMRSLFVVRKPKAVNEQHIILVDDVITTGATLEACARVLRESGATRITGAVFAAA